MKQKFQKKFSNKSSFFNFLFGGDEKTKKKFTSTKVEEPEQVYLGGDQIDDFQSSSSNAICNLLFKHKKKLKNKL